MKNNETVSAPQGGATPKTDQILPEITIAQMRERVKMDLKTARALTHIIGTDADVGAQLTGYLNKIVPGGTIKQVQEDAVYASALLTTLLDEDYILDFLGETLCGLLQNRLDKNKLNLKKDGL